MKKHWQQSGFLPSLSCSSQHTLISVSVTLCFAKMVTFLVWLTACCAVVNKLSTLFGFAVHCKTWDFNISLYVLLFIQLFIAFTSAFIYCQILSFQRVRRSFIAYKNLKPNSQKSPGPWPLVFQITDSCC